MIRIMLVDDQAIVREGMRSMISLEPDMVVVGEAADGREALDLNRGLAPDIILLDIRMPGMDGLETLARLKADLPRTSVIMVTLYDNYDYLERAVSLGAAGYILKDASREELVRTIRVTAEGGAIIDPAMLPKLMQRLRADQNAIGGPGDTGSTYGAQASGDGPNNQTDDLDGSKEPALTERELQVLRLVAEGMTNQQIGDELFISPTTVKTHIQNITLKLDVSDRTQAAVTAVRRGYI